MLTQAILAAGSNDIGEQAAIPGLDGWANETSVVGASSWFEALDTAADSASSTDSASVSSEEDVRSGYLGSNSALSEAMGSTEDILDQLIRLGLAIRKSGTNARLRKADSSFSEEDYGDLQRYLNLRLLVQARGSLGNRKKKTAEMLIDLDTSLHQPSPPRRHFIIANLRRRHRFVYARRHQRKLEGSLDITTVQNTKRTVQTPDATKTKSATPDQPACKEAKTDEQATGDHAAGDPAMTITTASAAEGDVLKATAEFSKAASRVSVTAAKLNYPLPPPVPEGVRSFKCPCCYQALPIMFKEKARWRYSSPEPIGTRHSREG